MNFRYLIVLAFIVVCGCKSDDTTASAEQSAVILDGANLPGLTTCGWVIRFDNRFGTTVIPTELAPEFQQDNLEVLVLVTNSTELAECTTDAQDRKVNILSIRLPG